MDFHIAIITLLCGSCVTSVNFTGHSDKHLETLHNDIISQHMMVNNDLDNRHPAQITALDVVYEQKLHWRAAFTRFQLI